MKKSEQNQRIGMFVRVEKNLYENIDRTAKNKEISKAKLMNTILRQFFNEEKNGKNTLSDR
jgi:metal-responsive CopG/Arc/MetJ family transcriptional regulator